MPSYLLMTWYYVIIPLKIPSWVVEDIFVSHWRYIRKPLKIPSWAIEDIFVSHLRYIREPLKICSLTAETLFFGSARIFHFPKQASASRYGKKSPRSSGLQSQERLRKQTGSEIIVTLFAWCEPHWQCIDNKGVAHIRWISGEVQHLSPIGMRFIPILCQYQVAKKRNDALRRAS